MKTRLLLAVLATALRAQSPVEQAAAALQAGDLATAEILLTPLATGSAPAAAAVHHLGTVRLRQGRAAEAITLAEQATQLAPDVADHHAQLGQALAQRMGEVGFMQQAMLSGRMKQAFARAVELDPRHLSGLIGLARWYAGAPEFAGGSLEKAREYAGRVREVLPWLGELELGRVAERAEQPAVALAHFEAAAALRPDHAGAVVACGRMLAALGRPEEARARFEAALRLNPNLEAARQGLAALAPAAG